MLRGKEPCFVLIDIKLTRVYPQPVCGYVGQEILHKTILDRRGGGWVHPQNMAASGVDGGENGSDVLVDQSAVLLPRFLVCQNFCVLLAAWGCSRSEANRA